MNEYGAKIGNKVMITGGRYKLLIREVGVIVDVLKSEISGNLVTIKLENSSKFICLNIEDVSLVSHPSSLSVSAKEAKVELPKEDDYVVVEITHSINTKNPRDIGKTYCFKCYDKIVSTGDLVLCDTQYGFTLGKVVWLHSKKIAKPAREIVQVIKVDDFNERARIKKEAEEKKAKLKSDLHSKVKEMDVNELYEILAKSNVEFNELYKEYKNL